MTAQTRALRAPQKRRTWRPTRLSLPDIWRRWRARRRAAHRAAALMANPYLARDVALSEPSQAPLPPQRYRS